MAYYDISLLASDGDFAVRCMACCATEKLGTNPQEWWSANSWAMAAAPGFGDAYASAVAGEVPNPGRDQAVISDSQILAAAQALPETG